MSFSFCQIIRYWSAYDFVAPVLYLILQEIANGFPELTFRKVPWNDVHFSVRVCSRSLRVES
ncbi:protein of unknown function [Pararobbsia alpina]